MNHSKVENTNGRTAIYVALVHFSYVAGKSLFFYFDTSLSNLKTFFACLIAKQFITTKSYVIVPLN